MSDCNKAYNETSKMKNLILRSMYNQLLSILTHSHIKRAFERWSNYDLRRHLAGMEKFTEHLIDRLDSSVAR